MVSRPEPVDDDLSELDAEIAAEDAKLIKSKDNKGGYAPLASNNNNNY